MSRVGILLISICLIAGFAFGMFEDGKVWRRAQKWHASMLNMTVGEDPTNACFPDQQEAMTWPDDDDKTVQAKAGTDSECYPEMLNTASDSAGDMP